MPSYTEEQKKKLIAQIEKLVAEGEPLYKAVRQAGTTAVSYKVWKEGGHYPKWGRRGKSEQPLQVKVTKDLNGSKMLKIENDRLRYIISQQALELHTLKEYVERLG